MTGDVISPPPASLTLKANATDRDGVITRVEFFVTPYATTNETKVGEDTTPDAKENFQVNWANPPEGQWMLTAKATDDAGTKRRTSRS